MSRRPRVNTAFERLRSAGHDRQHPIPDTTRSRDSRQEILYESLVGRDLPSREHEILDVNPPEDARSVG